VPKARIGDCFRIPLPDGRWMPLDSFWSCRGRLFPNGVLDQVSFQDAASNRHAAKNRYRALLSRRVRRQPTTL